MPLSPIPLSCGRTLCLTLEWPPPNHLQTFFQVSSTTEAGKLKCSSSWMPLKLGWGTYASVLANEVSTKLPSQGFQGKQNISLLKHLLSFAFPFLPA